MKAKLAILGVELEVEADNYKDLWQKIAFYQSLPTTCPIDDTPCRFGFRSPKGNDFYEVANTNPRAYITFHVGEHKTITKDLYPDGTWSWWDYEAKEELVLADWNTLTEDGKKMRAWLLGESTPKPASVKSEPKPKAGVAEPKSEPKPATPKSEPIAPKEVQQARKLMHALGSTLYGTEWNDKRAAAVKPFGKYRTPPVELTSSNDLTLDELGRLILKLEKAARSKIMEIVNQHDLDIEYSDYDPGAAIVEDLSGLPLYKLLKELMETETEA